MDRILSCGFVSWEWFTKMDLARRTATRILQHEYNTTGTSDHETLGTHQWQQPTIASHASLVTCPMHCSDHAKQSSPGIATVQKCWVCNWSPPCHEPIGRGPVLMSPDANPCINGLPCTTFVLSIDPHMFLRFCHDIAIRHYVK